MHDSDQITAAASPEARLEAAHRPVADRFGPYRLVAPLEPSRHADRWLAIDDRRHVNHAVHRLHRRFSPTERRRMVLALQRVAAVAHLHILPIESYTLVDAAHSPHHSSRAHAGSGEGEMWIVTPYTGSHSGLLTLEHLPALKGGRLVPAETVRGVRHLLEAAVAAHERALIHGPVAASEILVDRHGSLSIEFYGLARTLAGGTAFDPELARDEVRSIVALGYQLLTGMPADEPRIRAGRLVRKLDRTLDDWLDHGLDPVGGFDSALDALNALPGVQGPEPKRPKSAAPVSPVRTLLHRFRPLAPDEAE